MPDIDLVLSWWEWPDFARVALVLAAVAAVGGLVSLAPRWRRGRGAKAPVRPAGQAAVSNASSHHEEFPTGAQDPVLRFLHRVLRFATYVLAIAMVVVILEGVVSVIHTLYLTMSQPPHFMMPDIVKTFGVFLAVLIAYEIFANITLYLRTDVFPVKLVVATAVMAIARKVIVLDMDEYTAMDLIGIAAVVLSLGVAYWLIARVDAGDSDRRGHSVDG